MNYKKFQTTVRADGTVRVFQLGTIAADKVDADKEWERERLSKLARNGAARISMVEETDYNLVSIDLDGKVRIIHWVQQS